MDTKLKTALEQSEYMQTFQNQKRLLKEKFKKDCIVYYNGGMFVIDQMFVANIVNLPSDIVVDTNLTPVEVNKEEFKLVVQSHYLKAIETYNEAYAELCVYRDAKGLLT